MARRPSRRKQLIPPKQRGAIGKGIIPSVPGIDPFNMEQFEQSLADALLHSTDRKYIHPFSLQLNYLPRSLQQVYLQQFLDQYDIKRTLSEIGAPENFFFKKEPIKLNSTVFSKVGSFSGRPYGRYSFDWEELYKNRMAGGFGGVTEADVFLGVNYFQYDVPSARKILESGSNIGEGIATELIRPSVQRLYRPIMYRNVAEQFNRSMRGEGLAQGQVLVWDLETGGLARTEGVRQIGASIIDAETGEVVKSNLWNVRNDFFDLGVKGSPKTSRAKTLSSFLGGKRKRGRTTENEFSQAVSEFLEMAESTNYQMAGHNLAFDVGHLLSFRDTALYRSDEAVRRRFETFLTATRDSTKFFDTNLLSTLFAPGTTQTGLSSILQNTNALELIAKKRGATLESLIPELMRLHEADVDVGFERDLFWVMHKHGKLSAPSDEFQRFIPQITTALEHAERVGVQTPRMAIRSLYDFDERVFDRVSAAQYWDPIAGKMKHYYDSATGELLDADFGISGMEHLNMLTRGNIGKKSASIENLIATQETLNEYYGKYAPNRLLDFSGDRGILEDSMSASDFMRFSKTLASSGDPLAGLGVHDRLLTSALASAKGTSLFEGSDVIKYGSRSLADISEAIGLHRAPGGASVSRVIRTYQDYGLERTIIGLPVEELEKALSPLGIRPTSYYYEPFKTAAYQDVAEEFGATSFVEGEIKNVGMQYRFEPIRVGSKVISPEAQIRAIRKHVEAIPEEQLSKFGFKNAAEKEKFLEELSNTTTKDFGIQVGRFENEPAMYERLISLTGDPNIAATKDQRLSARVSHVGGELEDWMREQKILGEGELLMGPATLGHADDEVNKILEASSSRYSEQYLELFKQMRDGKMPAETITRLERMKRVRAGATGEATGWLHNLLKGQDFGDTLVSKYDKFVRRPVSEMAGFAAKHPKGAALTALAAAVGYYTYKDKKEMRPYVETLQKQPYETSDRFSYNQDQEIDQLTNPYTRSLVTNSAFPLVTAGVPRMLNENKIGHHRYGADKHRHLFAV